MRSSRWSRVAPMIAGFVGLCALVAASSDATAGRSDPDARARAQLAPASQQAVPNAVVVRFADGVPPGQARQAIADLGGSIKKEHGRSKLWVVELPEGADTTAVLAALQATGLFDIVGLDYVVSTFDAPDDPSYDDQWHLHDTTGGMWAESAWDLAPSAGAGVVVAVIDTGVAFEHHTAPAILWSPQEFAPAPDLAGVPIVAPWNFLANNGHANDDHGHGTHVSGTILQATGNGQGVAGVAHGASLMPVKILDYSGNGSAADLVESIYYAVDNGADVINMSLGFDGTGQPDAYGEVCTEIVGLKGALDYAFNAGVTVVAAAGNAGASVVACPAAYHTVISVGATRYDGQATFYSNSGFALDIAAPGGDPNVDQDGNGQPDGVLQETLCLDAFSMLVSGDYTQFCPVYMPGTSMASPHVAGVAALLLGENSSLTPLQVRYFLETTARERGAAGRDDVYGWGALDAHAAIAALQSGPPPVITPTPPPPPPSNGGPNAPTDLAATATSNTAIALTWHDNASNETGYKVERRVGEAPFSQVALLATNATSYTSTGLVAGTEYDFRVRAAGTPDSYYSNVASATTLPPPPGPDLSATALSTTSIRLDWTDNTNDETGFRLERSTNGGATWLLVRNAAANTTTYTNTSLTAGTTYAYRIRAYSGTVAGEWSDVARATTLPPPNAPSDLTATALSSASIRLDWVDNSSNETSFRIERLSSSGTWLMATNVGANVTTWTNSYLSAGTSYSYRVRASEGTAGSAWSNVATTATLPPPAAPSDLMATALSNSSIRLDWTDNSTGETGFRIERSSDGTNFSQVGTAGANVTTYTNNLLTAGATYWYRVRAYEGSVYGPYSEIVEASTVPPPPAPTGLVATVLSNSAIRLDWTDNATTETGYRVERSTNGGASWTSVATLAANAITWTNSNLGPATTYQYRVRARENLVYSGHSNVAEATTLPPPAAPSGLSATALSGSAIRLDWTDNSDDEQGFRIERSTDGVSWLQAVTLAAGVTTWTNSYLPADTTYYYRVRAYAGTAYSEYSTVAVATTWPPPIAPSGLTASLVTASKIQLDWIDNSGNETGFRIELSTNGGATWLNAPMVGAGVTTWSLTGAKAGITYLFRVRAQEGTTYSDYSNTVTITP